MVVFSPAPPSEKVCRPRQVNPVAAVWRPLRGAPPPSITATSNSSRVGEGGARHRPSQEHGTEQGLASMA